MKKKWIVLITVVLGTFMATLDGSIVNIALPSISAAFNIDIATVQGIVFSYLLTVVALLLIFGKLSDIVGRKILYIFGFLIFSIGSLLCAISTTISFLIIYRIIQAVGASILMSINQAIISDTFPVYERGRALGISGTVVALGNLTGPSLGGFLTEIFGWRSIFYINVPVGIMGAYLSYRFLDSKKRNSTKEPIFPIINIKLFRIKIFTYGLITAFLSFVASNALTIILPFYLQSIRQLSPAKSGLVLMTFPICMAVFAPISGFISDKIGFLIPTTVGLIIADFSYILLLTVGLHTKIFNIYLVMGLLGIGIGIFQSPNNSSVMSSVPSNSLGAAASINALIRNIGMVTGVTFSMKIYGYMMKSQGVHDTLDIIKNSEAFIVSMRAILYMCVFAVSIAAIISILRTPKK